MIAIPNATLDSLAASLRADNPTRHVYVDRGTVWLRDGEIDLGIYSATLDGKVCCCVEPSTRTTMVSRPAAKAVRS